MSARRALIRPPPHPSLRHRLLRLLESCRPKLSIFNRIHAQIIVSGVFLDCFAASRLLKFLLQRFDPPDLRHAELLFSQIHRPDVVTFNLLLQAMPQTPKPLRSFIFFRDLRRRDLRPNGYTFCFLLGCCSAAQAPLEGLQLHGNLAKTGLCRCAYVATSLVQFYGDSGDADLARHAFDEMSARTEVSWAVMTKSFADNGRLADALKMITSARKAGVKLCNSALVCILCKCAELGELFMGKMVHALITVMGLELNVILGTSLVGMYAKCGGGGGGGGAAAASVFSAMPEKSVGSWNCMIHGLAVNGGGAAAIFLFEEMQRMNVEPDRTTFVGVLTACRHSGLVAAGAEFFSRMIRDYQISPDLKHYGCLVDLYGRAGHLREALEVVRSMPMEPDAAIWGTILSSCRAAGDSLLGEMVAAKMVKLFHGESSGYLFLSDVYASSMKWGGAAAARKMMAEVGAWKTAPACSSVVL